MFLLLLACQEPTGRAPAASPCDVLDPDGDDCLSAEVLDCPGLLDKDDRCLDCDETDPTINTDAAEACGDAVDQDCSGDPNDVVTWIIDADGDGWGGEGSVTGCERPADAPDSHDDCDDSDATVAPDATEACGDAVDQDCSGDPNDVTTWYDDADGDGYGDDTTRATGCALPAGASDTGGDCDDGDPAIHPGLNDVWGNGVDEDCEDGDGVVGARTVTDGGLTRLVGADTGFGAPLVPVDFYGDGAPLLAIGTRAAEVYLTPLAAPDPATAVIVEGTSSSLGEWAAATDADGDGREELVLTEENTETLWVLGDPTALLADSAIALEMTGELQGMTAGEDIDGDGLPEIVVARGTWEWFGGDDMLDYAEITLDVRVLTGPLVGMESVDDGTSVRMYASHDLALPEEFNLTFPGDLNGDGYGDLAVEGGLYSGDLSEPYYYEDDLTVRPVGDLDGDGHDDLAAVYGQALVLARGPISSVDWAGSARYSGPEALDELIVTEDRDGDGVRDLLVSSPRYTASQRRGAIFPITTHFVEEPSTPDTKETSIPDAGALFGPEDPAGFGKALIAGGGGLLIGAPTDGTGGAVYDVPAGTWP